MDDYYQRAIAYLRSQFPEATEDQADEVLYDLVVEGTKVAQHYRFLSERDVMRFIDLRMRIGRDFDQRPDYPWAQAILNNMRILPHQKIYLLREAYEANCGNPAAA